MILMANVRQWSNILLGWLLDCPIQSLVYAFQLKESTRFLMLVSDYSFHYFSLYLTSCKPLRATLVESSLVKWT